MSCNCGFVQSDTAEDKLAKLPFENGGIAILKTRNRRKPRQCRSQHGMVREPEQVERRVAGFGCIARFDGALQRSHEGRPDQIADLAVQEAGKLAVLKMARSHEA